MQIINIILPGFYTLRSTKKNAKQNLVGFYPTASSINLGQAINSNMNNMNLSLNYPLSVYG